MQKYKYKYKTQILIQRYKYRQIDTEKKQIKTYKCKNTSKWCGTAITEEKNRQQGQWSFISFQVVTVSSSALCPLSCPLSTPLSTALW